ncbi:winged helix-turn-helix transcriptional regulator [Chryseobacterium wanjuense]
MIRGEKTWTTPKNDSGGGQKSLSSTTERIADRWFANKKIVKQKPLHIEYELTAMGESILPVLCIINNWGDIYIGGNERRSHVEK